MKKNYFSSKEHEGFLIKKSLHLVGSKFNNQLYLLLLWIVFFN